MSIQQTWRSLRSLRSDPPTPIGQDRRKRELFSASLEQSEQYFKAAEGVGHETRPVLAFYGLSQLGRAIAVATHPDRHKSPTDWQLSGHGVRVPGLSQPTVQGNIGRLAVRDQGKGSFTQLAQLLDSPSLSNPVPLAEIWDSIPEMNGYPLPSGGRYPALDLSEGADCTREDWGERGAPGVYILSGTPKNLPPLEDFLKHYPTVWPLKGLQENNYLPSPRRGLTGQIYLNPQRKYARGGFVALHGTKYRGRSFAFPALTGNSLPMHPILAWWAALYALSMLARYEPEKWAATVNVDVSKEAIPIEQLLHEALEAVPALALETMSEYSQSDQERQKSRLNKMRHYEGKEYKTFGELARTAIDKLSPKSNKGRESSRSTKRRQ
ncbi:YaaC family protein [Streptomyces hoynatensis]|nr:YaaC family protein [Streptomyces hoynatensis]